MEPEECSKLEEILAIDIEAQKPKAAAAAAEPNAEKSVGNSEENSSSRIASGDDISTNATSDAPPDGGFTAWLMAIMAHLVIFNTWGSIQSYGMFQTYFTKLLHRPPSDISWIGSLQIFLLFAIGTLSGRALDAGLFKPVFMAGLFLQLVGVFMTSLITKYWQVMLSQGILQGLGMGLQFCPTMALLSTYFEKNRSIAIGIAAAGTSTGGVIFPSVVQQLLPRIGFAWTIRILGFVMLAIGLLTAATLKSRLPPRKAGPIVELAAFKEPPYLFFCISMFLVFWGLYFAFYYASSFGLDIIGIKYEDSVTLIIAMNGIGVIGRVAPNYLADKTTGPLNLMVPIVIATAVVLYTWVAVRTTTGLWGFAAIYGLIASGVQGLFPAVLSSLTSDLSKAGVRMGMGFAFVGIASTTGPPLAGALIQTSDGRYLYAQMWAASSILLGGLILLLARAAMVGWKLKVKI